LERLASLFPQAQMFQGFWWRLMAVFEENQGNRIRMTDGAGRTHFAPL